MDIFAHGLWTAAAAKAVNNKLKNESALRQPEDGAGKTKPLNIRLAAFWGIFPDLFAFTIPFIWIAWGLLSGNFTTADLPQPHQVEPPADGKLHMVMTLANSFYGASHSAIVFISVFAIVWLLARRPVLELGGWFFHVLLDIPSHSYRFYPTPFLWPISGWKFHGISWSVPWFMILNYSALVVVYLLLWRKIKERKSTANDGSH
jgi:hypothetical protein